MIDYSEDQAVPMLLLMKNRLIIELAHFIYLFLTQ
jgi:hypothetical protein